MEIQTEYKSKCRKCGDINKTYHLQWEGITCEKCKKEIEIIEYMWDMQTIEHTEQEWGKYEINENSQEYKDYMKNVGSEEKNPYIFMGGIDMCIRWSTENPELSKIAELRQEIWVLQQKVKETPKYKNKEKTQEEIQNYWTKGKTE